MAQRLSGPLNGGSGTCLNKMPSLKPTARKMGQLLFGRIGRKICIIHTAVRLHKRYMVLCTPKLHPEASWLLLLKRKRNELMMSLCTALKQPAAQPQEKQCQIWMLASQPPSSPLQ